MKNNPLFSTQEVGDRFLRRDTLKTYLSAPTLQKHAAMDKKAVFFLATAPLLAAGAVLGGYGLTKDVPSLYRNVKKGRKWDATKDLGLTALDAAGFVPGASMLAASLRGGAAAGRAIQGAKGIKNLGGAVNVGQKAKLVNQGEQLGNFSKYVNPTGAAAKPGVQNFYRGSNVSARATKDATNQFAEAAKVGAKEVPSTGIGGTLMEGAMAGPKMLQNAFRKLQYSPFWYGKNIAPGMQAKYFDTVLKLSKTKPALALEMANRPEVFLPIVLGQVVVDPMLRKNRTPDTLQGKDWTDGQPANTPAI